MMETEKIFDVFQSTKKERVQLTTYVFREVAERWWTTVKSNYNTIAEDAACTTLVEEFNTKFIPDHIRDQKMEEFENLRQGDMTVHDYD